MPDLPEKDTSKTVELSEEDIFSNDVDPLEGIRNIRREEGSSEEELSDIISDDDPSQEDTVTDIEEEGKDELDNLTDTDNKAVEDDIVTDTKDAETETDLADGNQDIDNKTEQDDEKSDETVDKPTETESVKRKFKADGQEFEFTEQEMLDQFEVVFGQAMNFTQKTQKMAPYRKMISALESEEITTDQLNLAIDALKGNKQALQTIVENNKIDPFDLSSGEEGEQNNYTPTPYGKDEVQLDIEEITNRISKDPEYQITVDVVDNQWDQNSRAALSSNPRLISGLHNDIKSGMYDKVAPVAMKMKVLDGNTKSSLEYYMLAGEEVLASEKQNSVKAEQTVDDMNKKAQDAEGEFDQASSEARQKRAASPTRTRADRKGVTDYLDDDNDEKFDAWYKKLQASN